MSRDEQTNREILDLEDNGFTCEIDIEGPEELDVIAAGHRDFRESVRITYNEDSIIATVLANGLFEDDSVSGEISLKLPYRAFNAGIVDQDDHSTVTINAHQGGHVVELAEALIVTGTALLRTARSASNFNRHD